MFVSGPVTGQNSSSNKIIGRIVDEFGRPVPSARVYIHPAVSQNARTLAEKGSIDYIILRAETNSVGDFEVLHSTPKDVDICSTYNIDTSTFTPVGDLTACGATGTQRFHLNYDTDTLLGNIPISINYQKVTISLDQEKDLTVGGNKVGRSGYGYLTQALIR
jgi:hypothetical protein